MRKLLLTGSMLAAFFCTNAQQKLALYEEFSGENCGPCAALNPGLMTLLSANPTKVLLLKYQSPIPSAGPIYLANTIFTDARMDYYSVPFAPYGRLNGAVAGSTGNISEATQAMIDAAVVGTAPFTITVSNPVYNADGQTFTATVTVTASVAATYSNLKLRFAYAEEMNYTTAPGTNGETSFHNVVRQMYPNADGQNAPSTWTAGQVQNFTITGSIPSYAATASNPSTPHHFFVAFLQTDNDKKVLQASKTADITVTKPAVDIASNGISGVSGLICQLPSNINATVSLKNPGQQTLTTATIYYRVGAGAWSSYVWNGSIPAGGTGTATLPPIAVTVAGQQVLTDSIVLPNNKVDHNSYDNVSGSTAYVLNNTAAPLPLAYDFEAVNANWISWPGNGTNPYPILRVSSGTGNPPLGAGGSTYAAYFNGWGLPAGYTGFYLFPKAELPAGPKAVDFQVAYAQWKKDDGTLFGDKLELMYSIDCGANWVSVWSQANDVLATAPPTTGNNPFIPTAASYKPRSVNVSTVPTGAYFAFKATSGNGNYMFIDNINVRTGSTTGIDNLVKEGGTKIYPNPTTDVLQVELELLKASKVTFTIYNALGQSVGTVSAKELSTGISKTTIDTKDLSAGMYYLNIATEAGSIQQKFTKL
ncbi:MAG: T9SS type A sorting domain-containing protein [Taibaiella sp.]|jgi:hypothetical protein